MHRAGGFCLPQWHSRSLSVQSGYYGYGRAGDKEGAKKRWRIGKMKPKNLSCDRFSQRRLLLGKEQCPRAAASGAGGLEHPRGAGQTGIPIETAAAATVWEHLSHPPGSAGGDGHVPMGSSATSTASSTKSCRAAGSVMSASTSAVVRISVCHPPAASAQLGFPAITNTTLMPNTRYRLIISGEWWGAMPRGRR
jgi:hypothetical protein